MVTTETCRSCNAKRKFSSSCEAMWGFPRTVRSVLRSTNPLHTRRWVWNRRCKSPSSLVGRDFVEPLRLSISDVETLVWTASDLKQELQGKRKTPPLLEGVNVTLLLSHHCCRAELAVTSAVRKLGGNVTLIDNPTWEECSDAQELGKMISELFSDMVVVVADNHCRVLDLAEGSPKPVVCISDHVFQMVQALADVMSIQEHFGHTRSLLLGWVGPSLPMFNSYLLLLPMFGIHINYLKCYSNGNGEISQAVMDLAIKMTQKNCTELHECLHVKDTVRRANIIATTSHGEPSLKITTEVVNEAAEDWVFLHNLPRSNEEVTDEVFGHKNSMVWQSTRNYMWMTMAIILKLLAEYEPKSTKPTFQYLTKKRKTKKEEKLKCK
ncbi:ornithine carbamoyltransferase, mitochondrial-like [Periplaneta americana]|uniref:ornithine carbamoyltransferase, mitochondrial-like n=1 Tax=Periplaneta americana TaxID=6978 RepID=UPI0037E7E801